MPTDLGFHSLWLSWANKSVGIIELGIQIEMLCSYCRIKIDHWTIWIFPVHEIWLLILQMSWCFFGPWRLLSWGSFKYFAVPQKFQGVLLNLSLSLGLFKSVGQEVDSGRMQEKQSNWFVLPVVRPSGWSFEVGYPVHNYPVNDRALGQVYTRAAVERRTLWAQIQTGMRRHWSAGVHKTLSALKAQCAIFGCFVETWRHRVAPLYIAVPFTLAPPPELANELWWSVHQSHPCLFFLRHPSSLLVNLWNTLSGGVDCPSPSSLK